MDCIHHNRLIHTCTLMRYLGIFTQQLCDWNSIHNVLNSSNWQKMDWRVDASSQLGCRQVPVGAKFISRNLSPTPLRFSWKSPNFELLIEICNLLVIFNNMAQAPVAEEKVKEEQKATDPNKSIVSNSRYYSFIRCKYTKKRHSITLKEISTLFKSAKDCASILEKIYCKDVLQYVESNQTITLSRRNMSSSIV